MKDKSTKDLVMRMNEINREMDLLEIEYNRIVKELWERVPSIKNDESIQMKRRIKTKED